MARPSSIDRLPKELRELIGRLLEEGSTIDQILDKLNELGADVSRSALGRHTQKLADVGERMRRARVMAEALTARLGDQPENQVARMNMELMHGMVFELITAAAGSEDEEGEPVMLDPKSVKFLSGALKDLASAQKVDADRVLKLREEIARENAKKMDEAVDTGRIDAEAAERARQILGFV